MKIVRVALILAICFWAGSAYSYTYNVSGSVNTLVDGIFEISGTMEISDLPDITLPTASSNGHFEYIVTGFDINFGAYNFVSASGQQSMIHSIHYSTESSTTTFDPFNIRGTGDMTQWSNLLSDAKFYNSNGDLYNTGADYADFLNTPYTIEYSGPMEIDLNGYGTALFNNLTIARVSVSTPVPGSFLLLLIGLAGICIKRRR